MRCGCIPRLFRRGSRTSPLADSVDALLTKKGTDNDLSQTEPYQRLLATEDSHSEAAQSLQEEEKMQEVENSAVSLKVSVAPEETEEKSEVPGVLEKKPVNAEKSRRNVTPFFRSLFRGNTADDTSATWIRCELRVDEGKESVELVLRFEKLMEEMSNKKGTMSSGSAIQSIFRIRGRKPREESDGNDLIRARRLSSASAKSDGSEEEEDAGETIRPKERSMFCFGWGSSGVPGNDDETITMSDGTLMTEAPPGLVGLVNLGNTCFLNAALQCLRCTPGLATLMVPELSNGFNGVVRKHTFGQPSEHRLSVHLSRYNLKRLRNRSHSSSSWFPHSLTSEWETTLLSRTNSLPALLPYEIRGRLEGVTGLAGGSGLRLSSVPNLAMSVQPSSTSTESVLKAHDGDGSMSLENSATNDKSEEPHDVGEVAEQTEKAQEDKDGGDVDVSLSDSTFDTVKDHDHCKKKENAEPVCEEISTTNKDQPSSSLEENSENKEITEDTKGDNKEVKEQAATGEENPDVELSVDFISAFQKLVLELCLGDPDNHRSPKDLYVQLKKLPHGEWYCDGGQHDCQEIIKVLLDTIHANYTEQGLEHEGERFGRCISDVSSDLQLSLHAIELENLKANSLWKRYLSNDSSPITDVFAGQLQIVRSCQKCHSRSTTYEPFWDLSLSLSREKSSWFNPGRMPSCLDDLLRAFTAAEVLQGNDAPYCECCSQKSPATRRILLHRFPKVLVINIKRFKYTKDGREKLTSNISFPIRSLRLHNFASKEHQHEGLTELYDLYAVSNHYGNLGGGHYVAYCKVKDGDGKDGWYCFNDKVVTKVAEESVVTPNAYVLFYAKRPISNPPSNG